MDDFDLFADLGYRPQGKAKAAPMKSTSGSDAADRSRSRSSAFTVDDQNRDDLLFNDVFGGPPKYSSSTNNSSKPSGMSDFDYDSVFKNSSVGANEPKSKSTSSSSTLPVYDKPVYDDDIFDGLPGMKSNSMSARYEENVFASMVSPPKRSQQKDHFDDLLGNLGRTEKAEQNSSINSKSQAGFDDLLPGFGSGSPAAAIRPTSEPSQIPKQSGITKEASSNVMDDPFVVLESTSTPGVSSPGFTDPLEEISKLSKPESAKAGGSVPSGGVFDDIDPLNGFGKSAPGFSNENRGKERSPIREGSTTGRIHNSTNREPFEKTSSRFSETHTQKKVPVDDFMQSHKSPFDMRSVSRDSRRSFDQTASPPTYANHTETVSQVDASPRYEEDEQPSDDIWLTVAEIPLFTQLTRAPPPSRPPPPIPRHTSRSERGSFSSNSRRKGSDFSSSPSSVQYSQSPRPYQPTVKSPISSPVDDLENFAMDKMHNNAEETVDILGEEMDSNSAADAMKEAMDRAEAKFRHAKEVREREHAKAARNKETAQMERDEETMEESQDGELRENRERLEQERRQMEKEEEERERRRLEKERAREIEREKARQAVERATREARERAGIEARERAAAEARLKTERAAVQRAQAEARERAALGARERAERAAVEARERAAAEARERVAAETREKEARDKAAVARAEADARRRAQRAAVDRVAAEARERAAAEAQERAASAAAAARMNQQKNDNDLESFFSTRPSSAPRPRASSSDPASVPHSQSRGAEGPRNTSSSGVSSNMRKTSSTTNIVDDLSSIFGAAASAGDFPDVEGETEERRRARLERHHRTQDRAAKALAEKNQRDLQTLREQEERHRIGDTLDIEIKRWSAGKEGNLRALLSTMQYVLWPECGWQPVSLTDLITGASVKKAYRKATLCIHPDKVQQKGANLQHKYVAEKVFDLLKEAWNKFNSEELF